MHVYVAQQSYPSSDLLGEVLCVGTEWNRVIKQIMDHYDLDQYTQKIKHDDRTWEVHVDGDLYIRVTKFSVNDSIPGP